MVVGISPLTKVVMQLLEVSKWSSIMEVRGERMREERERMREEIGERR